MDNQSTDARCNADRIDEIVKILQNTEMGAPVVEFGLMKDVQVVLDMDMETAGYYSETLMGAPTISLNANLDNAVLVVALAHELRHVEQMMVQSVRPSGLPPLDAIRMTRILEADASAYSAGTAYEIFQKTGDRQYLDALADYEEEDIGDAFIAAATPGKSVREDITPFCAAFEQWFNRPERIEHYDRATIKQYSAIKSNPLLSLIFNAEAKAELTVDMLKDISAVASANYLEDSGIKKNLLSSERYVGNISASVSRLAARLEVSPV